MPSESLSSGALNRRVSIQRQTTSQATNGELLQVWTTFYTCWARIDVQRSQLLYSTAEFVSKVTHRITMRWTKSQIVQPNMRIQYTEPSTSITHTYEIQALLNADQGNVSLVALCYELNAAE